jgi:hypothetical protein
MERVLGSQGKNVRLKIDCQLLKLIMIASDLQAGVNTGTSNHPIQNPLLLVTEP